MKKLLLTALMLALMGPQLAYAQRDAAFVQPSLGGGHKEGDEVIEPTPKAVDVGETAIGITKRVTLFFTNYSGREAQLGNVSINADSNVRTNAVQNDCATLDKLKPNDKCTVIVEITPNSPGKWTAEIVLVHDQAGRVSRATITGSTAGDTGGQMPGLSLVGAAKDQLIDFGEVPAGSHAVRSVLLANDSPNPLKIERIALMAADKNLEILDKDGCAEGMEVTAGSSCPVTVLWTPGSGSGEVSTDLIIRHTGPVGFAIIPVRGKSGAAASAMTSNASADRAAASLPVANATGGIPPVPADALFARAANDEDNKHASSKTAPKGLDNILTLRGTTGDQALIGTEEGTVALVGVGQTLTTGGIAYKIITVDPTSVTLSANGRQQTLQLQKPVSTIMAYSTNSNGTAGTAGTAGGANSLSGHSLSSSPATAASTTAASTTSSNSSPSSNSGSSFGHGFGSTFGSSSKSNRTDADSRR